MATPNFMAAAADILTSSPAPRPPTSQQTQISCSSQQQQTPPSSSSQQQQPTSGHKSPPPHTSSPQFITVTVSEQESPGGSGGLQTHPTYVQYVDSATADLYPSPNGQMPSYSVYSVADSSPMYTPATSYYNNGTTTYSQGQILAHNTGTYIVQGGSLEADSLIHARSSPTTVHLLEEGGVYKVQSELLEEGGHHTGAGGGTPRISPVAATNAEDPRKDILPSYPAEHCVIQTLHGSHELPPSSQPSQAVVPVAPTPQQQPSSTQGGQHQNVRDMDIIHVQWLIDNYETAEGVSLPRSTLYAHYLRHCTEHKLEPVNAASFGKLIRSVFLGLRTRRLGTRGNSKYHYYGIRVKPTSPLNQIVEELGNSPGALRQAITHKRSSGSSTNSSKGTVVSKPESQEGGSSSSSSVEPPHHQQYLGDPAGAVPPLPDLPLTPPDGLTPDDLRNFRSLYRQQCEAFLDSVISLQFNSIETLWQTFWRQHTNSHTDYEKILAKSKLYQLCQWEPVQVFVRQTDYQFYQNLVDVLIPEVLRPIPSSLTQAIRNFAKSLEGWLTTAMAGCPEEIVKIKVSAASAFSQTLRRYTSLNHLAQAARAVLQNSQQISQMLADLNRVDFHNVQEQASWVCQCEETMVRRLEQDFKSSLQQHTSLEQWAGWLEGVVALVLRPHERPPSEFPRAARDFLLRWSFYSSMVIRDLTLRSAASFGSFHLIRLLYDEYMFYLIEHCVAKATGETPIAVIGEFIGGQGCNKSHRLMDSGGGGGSSNGGPLGEAYLANVTNGLKESLGLMDQSSSDSESLHKKLKMV